MVAEAANTTVSILRGETTDQFGDIIDANDIAYSGVPAILVETSRQTSDPSNPSPRTVRSVVLTVPEWIGLLNSDRIRDEATGNTFMVIEVTKPPTLMGAPVDTSAVLKRVTPQPHSPTPVR